MPRPLGNLIESVALIQIDADGAVAETMPALEHHPTRIGNELIKQAMSPVAAGVDVAVRIPILAADACENGK